MSSFISFLGKIKIKGDLKGFHKKTELSRMWGNDSYSCILTTSKKKKAWMGAKEAEEFPIG